ncbi:hypothetical protein [Crateriforma conspicua]|uniref:Uncharacterized protein n=1 Tax=Crateriforma conspicua TaxID=2527996 RepID=A0A5C6FTB8_9PLAN|nr:hypothetical protein [Crateriforma conspicua]TWU63441.1 hypothetical protein V7x_51810 [Crateriforma conspicua]
MTSESVTRWTQWRELFAATRELLVVAAILLLLIAPGWVKETLKAAGISSVAGIEFELEQVVTSQAELEAAETEIEKIRGELLALQSSIQRSQSTGTGTNATAPARRQFDPANRDISRMLASTITSCDDAKKRISVAHKHQQDVIEQAERMGIKTSATLKSPTELVKQISQRQAEINAASAQQTLSMDSTTASVDVTASADIASPLIAAPDATSVSQELPEQWRR